MSTDRLTPPVPRFNFYCWLDMGGKMDADREHDADGDYIEYGDYLALERTVAELTVERDDWKRTAEGEIKVSCERFKSILALQARLDATEKRLRDVAELYTAATGRKVPLGAALAQEQGKEQPR